MTKFYKLLSSSCSVYIFIAVKSHFVLFICALICAFYSALTHVLYVISKFYSCTCLVLCRSDLISPNMSYPEFHKFKSIDSLFIPVHVFTNSPCRVPRFRTIRRRRFYD